MRTQYIPLTLILVAASAAEARAAKLDPSSCAAGGSANYGAGLDAWQPGDPGRGLLRHTLTGVNARCNDGSPAVMYIRPSSVGSHEWVIHFDGGGGCRDGQSCLNRWCGVAGAIFDQAAKMSSLGMPEALEFQGGILNEIGGGPFSTYNQVFIKYCSSDNWIGSADVGTAIDPTTGAPPSYDIEFQGEAIVADVIATLRNGPTFADPLAMARYYPAQLPDLDLATKVILSGDSAGSGGLRHHADRIADQLIPNGTLVYAAVDAGFSVAWYKFPPARWVGSPHTDYADYIDTDVIPAARGFWGADDSALDQSCLVHAPDPARQCLDTDWVLENHIVTPFFVGQDLNDPLARDRYLAWGMFANGFDFMMANARQLRDLAVNGIEPRGAASGVIGLNCNNHVMILMTNKFTNWRVSALAGSRSFQTLLNDWIVTGVGFEVQADNPAVAGYTASICP